MFDLTSLLKAHSSDFHRVVPFNPTSEKIIALDFTETNTSLDESIFNDVALFSRYIYAELKAAHALYGIGGYAELRNFYARSAVFDGVEGAEPRRLHLGLDIWGKAGTPIFAPLDGVIHSLAFNNKDGDYGATIILSHHIQGQHFNSLYGHLSLNDLEKQPGELIRKGSLFARMGEPRENGNWPPHLHFQLIRDLGNYVGDYPGVCKYSERHWWLQNCPDPDLLAQLNAFL